MAQPTASGLPPRTSRRRVKVIHFYSVPWEDVTAATPAVLMIAATDLLSGKEFTAAVHLAAEARQISPGEIRRHLPDLERDVLSQFCDYARSPKSARWLHWNMDTALIGFPAINQRARHLGVPQPVISERNTINFAAALKYGLGETYAPHPRLESLIRLNGVSDQDWLDLDQLTAAIRAGEYTRALRSLLRRVRGIATIFDMYIRGELKHQGQAPTACPLRSLFSAGADASRMTRSAGTGLLLQDASPGLTTPALSDDTPPEGLHHLPGTPIARGSTEAGDQADRVSVSAEPDVIIDQQPLRAPDVVEWTRPDLPSQWARLYQMSPSTFKRRIEEGKIRHKKLSSKSYQIAVADLPAAHQSRFRESAGQRRPGQVSSSEQ